MLATVCPGTVWNCKVSSHSRVERPQRNLLRYNGADASCTDGAHVGQARGDPILGSAQFKKDGWLSVHRVTPSAFSHLRPSKGSNYRHYPSYPAK
jgi:hypothetical protein